VGAGKNCPYRISFRVVERTILKKGIVDIMKQLNSLLFYLY